MKISIQWLNQYLDRPVDAAEADAVLTSVGFPIDGTETFADDTVIDVEVTSNRGDCLSHAGIAREIAAATGRSLKAPAITLPATSGAGDDVHKLTSITNDAPAACPVYTARLITGVKIAPSPAWLQRHLQAIGLRPINNIVDVTNFVQHELGQPLHAFDLNKLAEHRIVIRQATSGEPFTAIDQSQHKLRAGMLVIADAQKPVAIAGIMGGLDSEVTHATTDILLESAAFDPLSVRTTSRALKLASDSSYRFERCTDPRNIERAGRRAAQLIVELAGGSLANGVIRVGDEPPQLKRISMRPARCNLLLGYDLPVDRMITLLSALELQPKITGDQIDCTVPSHRLDLEREVDLIEEVARLAGYDAIPMHEKMPLIVRPPQTAVLARQRIGQVLVSHGYHETITFSNIAPKLTQPFTEAAHQIIMLDDERKAAEPALRTSLLPSLLSIRKSNQDAGNTNVKLFEVARAFSKKDGQFAECKELALLADAPDALSMRDLCGTLEELLHALGCGANIVEAGKFTPTWAQTAALIMETADPDHIIGVLGVPTRQVLDLFDLKSPVQLAWLDYETITSHYPRQIQVQPLPKFPGIERDLSILVDESATWQSVQSAVAAARPQLLDSVQFIGVYRGKQIGAGRKSVTLRLTFRDPNATLRHDQVDPQVSKIVAQLQSSLAAELRVG